MTTTTEIIEIPLSEVGLDPLFQVRAVDPEAVQRLVENWLPEQCEPIWVRSWPQDDARPRPAGCEHACYQVASGWTRTTAAREMGLATLPAVVQEMNDLDFRAWALKGNAFHGRRMTPEETRAQVALLAQGMSQREIAKKTGVSQSTVSRMLKDPSTSRVQAEVIHTNQPTPADVNHTNQPGSLDEVSARRAEGEATPLDAREVTQVGVQVARVWAAALPHLRVAAVQAWLSTLDDVERAREARNALALAAWLVAYSKESGQPRFTPGQLAATRRTSGETMDVIFDTLFADSEMLGALLGKDGAA